VSDKAKEFEAKKRRLIQERLQVHQKANDPANNKFRELLLERCRRDIVFWCNYFAITYDPRSEVKLKPFILFDRQEEYLEWRNQQLKNKEHSLVEKSRDAGLSWLNCAGQTHGLLFKPDYAGGMASRILTLVDSSDNPDCLFWKIDALIEYLPSWMKPEIKRRIGIISNKDNNASITGEGGPNIGRAGRKTLLDLDEAAFLEQPQRVDSAVSQNSDCVIWTSTPNGRANPFAQKRFGGYYPVFTFYWTDDPRKDQDWYERQKARLAPQVFAQEVEIDYSASVEGILIQSDWVRAAVNAHEKIDGLREAGKRRVAGRRVAGLDVATQGKNRNVFIVRKGVVVQEIETWQGLDTTQSTFWVDEKMRELKVNMLHFDADGVGAGVAGTLNSVSPKYEFNALHGAGRPSDRDIEGEDRVAKEKYANKRAELYGQLAVRFRKTYERVEGIYDHHLEELISIPNHSELISQLSQPTVKFTSTGKMLLESKDDLKRRGVESPDFADALAYSFEEEESMAWMLAV